MTTLYVLPPPASRQDALGRLWRERWHAADAGEWGLVGQLDARIEVLTAQSTSTNPRRETAAARTPRKERHVSR